MLILEYLESGGKKSRRLNIAVIGTCRVHNPFLSLVRCRAVDKLRRDFNTFTHSGDEALQHIRYSRGELNVPNDLAPYIFGVPTAPALSQTGIKIASNLGLLVVEICTLNRIQYREFIFQPNFFARFFVGKGEGSLLPWWRLASRGLPGANELAEQLILERRDKGEPFSALEEDILRNLTCWQVDYEGCRNEMRRVADAADGPVIFVPHFSIEQRNRPRLQEREQLRQYVVHAAEEIGEPCLDATPLLREVGEERGRKNGGKDLHHYSAEFEDDLGDHYLKLIQELISRHPGTS